MSTDLVPATNGAGYSARSATKAPDWHGLVVWDLLLNNLATGLFLVAALGEGVCFVLNGARISACVCSRSRNGARPSAGRAPLDPATG